MIVRRAREGAFNEDINLVLWSLVQPLCGGFTVSGSKATVKLLSVQVVTRHCTTSSRLAASP